MNPTDQALPHQWLVADPHGVVLLVHGALEHGARYGWTAAWLNQLGLAVVAGDLPGWGTAPGRRGHVDDFDTYLDALHTMLQAVQTRFPDLPLILLGHSQGGLVVLRYLQTRALPPRLAGVVLSSPALALRGSATLKAALGRRLARWLPRLALDTGIRPWHVSRSSDKHALIAHDPHTTAHGTLGWFRAFEQAIAQAWQHDTPIAPPLLVLLAGADQLLFADEVARYFATPRATEQQVQMFPDLYHEVLDEPERAQVRAVLHHWLQQRLPGLPPPTDHTASDITTSDRQPTPSSQEQP